MIGKKLRKSVAVGAGLAFDRLRVASSGGYRRGGELGGEGNATSRAISCRVISCGLALTLGAIAYAQTASAQRPNIVMLMTDDTGWNDLGAYSGGGLAQGHPTPNVDRMAKEGAVFTSWYGQASCTAGRASFMTGRIPIRSALSIVVAPGDENFLRKETPTIAEFFQGNGYSTYFSGKCHMGDKPEAYPTEHGFGEMKNFAAYYAGVYAYNDSSKWSDSLMELDDDIGRIMDEIWTEAPNTIVILTADNGAWPDAGATPFRGDKGSAFEGGRRVPAIVWWTGHWVNIAWKYAWTAKDSWLGTSANLGSIGALYNLTMDPYEKYDMIFNGAAPDRALSSSPGKYYPALLEFDQSIVRYPSIKRFPGGASNDLVPDLQHPDNPLPLLNPKKPPKAIPSGG
jgi:hypothetical protein